MTAHSSPAPGGRVAASREAPGTSKRRALPWALIIVGTVHLAVGIGVAILLLPTTAPGADLATYQRGAADWLATGDAYRSAALYAADFQYRYPPMLAMLMPILGWPPLWYSLMAGATAVPMWLAYRRAGATGVLFSVLLVGLWGQQLINGNVQPAVIALLAIVPLYRRAGAVGLAVATMLKLHPALAVAWYLGRRDWTAVRWYAGATVVLLAIQAPWLGEFIEYYRADPAATDVMAGMSLRAFGLEVWLIGSAALFVATIVWANSRYGWMLATLLQLAALPRVLLVNLALLLAAMPLERPRRDRSLQVSADTETPDASGRRPGTVDEVSPSGASPSVR